MKLAALWVVAFALAATCTVAPAHASPIDGATITKSKRVALDFWKKRHKRVCKPLRVINVSNRKSVLHGAAGALGYAPYGPLSNSSPHCSVHLNKSWNWKQTAQGHGWTREQLVCAVITHEMGHLVGLGHKEKGIMAPDLRAIPTECKKVFPSPPPPPIDSDRDGVPTQGNPNEGTRSDVCPDERGNASDGCSYGPDPGEDQDADGVDDSEDLCPGVPGTYEWDGCPPDEPTNTEPEVTDEPLDPADADVSGSQDSRRARR